MPATQEKARRELAEFAYLGNRLHALPDCYKIKLCSSGSRLGYQVIAHEVVTVERREREQVYRKAAKRRK